MDVSNIWYISETQEYVNGKSSSATLQKKIILQESMFYFKLKKD